jgi:hypothetical protein
MVTVLRSAQIGTSGKTVAFTFEDGAGTTANVTAVTSHPTLTVNGAPVVLANPVWGATAEQRLPFVLYPLATAISAGATVTAAAEAGWATTTAGAAPAMVAQVVGNATGRTYLPVFVAESKTMSVGYNLHCPVYYLPAMVYANLARQIEVWGSYGNDPATEWTLDADGYPIAIAGGAGAIEAPFTGASGESGTGDASGYPAAPIGAYVVRWDGTDAVTVRSVGGRAVVRNVITTGGIGANSELTFDAELGDPTLFYPFFYAVLHGPDVRNLRIYPPGIDPDDPPQFHPEILRMLAGTRAIRFMDAANTNLSSVATAADLARTTGLSPSQPIPTRSREIAVTAVGPGDNSDGYFWSYAGWATLAITSAAPHGLAAGQVIQFHGFSGLLALAGGGSISLNGYQGAVRVIDATRFAVGVYLGAGADGAQTLAGWATLSVIPGIPVEDQVALCAAVGADPWTCVPHALNDAGVSALATRAAAAMTAHAGMRLRVEFTNEHWNMANGFYSWQLCHGQGMLSGLTGTQWYAKRAGEIHALFRAAFTASGLDPGRVVRVFGGQLAYPAGPTAEIVAYCVAQGIPIDEFAVAPYMGNGPWVDDLAAITGAFDADQSADSGELYVQHASHFNAGLTPHRAALDAAGLTTTPLVCYEGGPEGGRLAGQTVAQAHAWIRHPRMRGILLRFLQQQQDQGAALFVDYTLTMPLGRYTEDGELLWSAYLAWNMRAGLGDGSDGQFDNRTDYEALDQIVSVVGKAMDEWESLASGDDPDPPVIRQRFRGRRRD